MGQRRFPTVGGSGDDSRSRREPNSLSEFARRALIAIALMCAGVIALWLGYKAMNVFLAIFAGALIAVLFRTMAEPLIRHTRLPVWASVIVVFVLTLGVFALAGWLMAPAVSQQFDEMAVRLPEAIDRFRAQFLSYRWAQWLVEQGGNATDGQKVLKEITHAFQITFTAVAAIIIVTFLALYMSAQPALYVNGLLRLAPVNFRARAREVMKELYRVLRMWLLTKLFTMVLTGVGIWIGLYLLKVPLALALAVVAGILEFIPTIGPLLSCIPAILIALMISPFTALEVAGVYFVVQWVGNHVATPLIQQRTLAIPPAVTLALVAILGTFFGFGGLLMSGPLTVVVFVLVKMLYVEDVLEKRRGRPRREYERPTSHRDLPKPGSENAPL